MQRLSAYLGVVAMLVALATAPLFHSHDHNDHGTALPLVHAHFLEHHEAELHADPEIEEPHGHQDARWIDYFTFQPPAAAFVLDIDFPEQSVAPVFERRAGVILISEPRAHSPPEGRRSVPRSPPIL